MAKVRRHSSRRGPPGSGEPAPARDQSAPASSSRPSPREVPLGEAKNPRGTGGGTQSFGKYVLVSKLASGGMAVTYRGRLTAAAGVTKAVVLKQILPHFADDDHFVQMFIAEARVAASLSHGNIAQVFDFGEVDGQYYLAMEFVHGQPLSQVLRRARTVGLTFLPTPIALLIGMKMCEGLHYAHTRVGEDGRPLNIVHRDVSPENVMVSYEGEVKLLDFGIAKTAELGASKTAPGTVKGKYPYFSPEQARAQDELDHRSDVFSSGLVLYEMLCGRRAYPGDFAAVIRKAFKADFPAPSTLNPFISPELESILLKGLARDRDTRFASSKDFGEALGEFLHREAPAFSPTVVSHLMSFLFQKELEEEGRTVDLPKAFVDSLREWMKVEEASSSRPVTVASRPSKVISGATKPIDVDTRPAPPSFERMPPAETGARGKRSRARDLDDEDDDDLDDEKPRRSTSGDLHELETRLPPSRPKAEADWRIPVKQDEDEVPKTAQTAMPPSPDDPALRARQHRLVLMISVPIFLLAIGVLALSLWYKYSRNSSGPPPGSMTRLWISSAPSGAEVILDGKKVPGTTPLVIHNVLVEEAHTLVVTAPGRRAWTHRFTPTPGKMENFLAELPPGEDELSAPVADAGQNPVAPAPSPTPSAPPGGTESSTPEGDPTDILPSRPSFHDAEYPLRVMVLRTQYNALPVPHYPTVSKELTPGMRYEVWFEGSASLGAIGSVSSLAYYLEGDVPARSSFGLFGRVPHVLYGGKRLHVFALDPDPSDNRGSLRINIMETKWKSLQFAQFNPGEHALDVKREHKFVLRKLSPRSTYLMTTRDDLAETRPNRTGRVGRALCAQEMGTSKNWKLIILDAGKRYRITGVSAMECLFPDEIIEDNAGAIDVDIVDVTALKGGKTKKAP